MIERFRVAAGYARVRSRGLAFARALVVSVAGLLGAGASVPAAAQEPVPPELAGWQDWVLHGAEDRRCPWRMPDPAQRLCAWPARLQLSVDASGGRFAQRWTVEAESWVPLPGDGEHWPEDVTVDGAPAAVVDRDGPSVRLARGSYAIEGRFRWSQRPAALAVPAVTGLVQLTVDGRAVAFPELAGGRLALGARAVAATRDALVLQVHRRLADTQPARLTTRLQLDVAGQARELVLPPALPASWRAIGLEAELPARLEADGRLRLQVRPGRYAVMLEARASGVAAEVDVPKVGAPWPAEEIWSFAPEDRLRIAAVEGAPAVDPGQVGVPGAWAQLPAYRVAAGDALRVVERSRGLSAQDGNELTLRRTLWRDFDGGGWTALDVVQGRMRQGWALVAAAPWRIASATANGEPVVVDAAAGEGASTAIELRSPDVDVQTLLRAEATSTAATGYAERFAAVSGELRLAPGHRLLAVVGADRAPTAWLERWHLLDVFLVLLVGAAAWRIAGLRLAVLALAALTLTYHEDGAPTWLWVNLVVALALASVAPAGRLREVAAGWRVLAFAAVLLALLPFAATQARLAFYPQLEVLHLPIQTRLIEQRAEEAAPAPAAMPAPPPPVMGTFNGEGADPAAARAAAIRAAEQARRDLSGDVVVTAAPPSGIADAELPRYAPGAIVQAGPGRPEWAYQPHEYAWSGPVDADDTVRFVVLPPLVVGLWRLLGLLLSVALLIGCAAHAWDRLAGPRRWLLGGRAPAAVAVVALFAASAAPDAARAASTPDPQLLQQLRERLLEPPRCAPSCAELTAGRVRIAGDRLEIVLEVGALDLVAVPLPGAGSDAHWQPDELSLDGAAGVAVHRDANGTRWVAVPRGRHVLRITGPVADVDAVKLAFPLAPRVVDVATDGWVAGGVVERRLVGGALDLARVRDTRGGTAAPEAGTGGEFAPYVTVERRFRFGLDWEVYTRVIRVAPAAGALNVRVPLLPGETPTTPGLEVVDGAVVAGFGAGTPAREWRSALARTTQLALVASDATTRGEVWRFEVGPTWQATFAGPPAVMPASLDGAWVHEYWPRAGEKLLVTLSRPKPAEGGTLAFDAASLALAAGRRSSDAVLELRYRSTQGGRHVLRVPADARVTEVLHDGAPLPLRPENGELAVPLAPGEHALRIRWEGAEGAGLLTRAPPVDLGAPTANLTTAVAVPDARWVLYARGPGVGPAILYWGELIVFLALAWWLGGSGLTPLGRREWLLLGLGLSTFSWLALGLVAAWLVLYRLRERSTHELASGPFNVRQVGLAALAVAALVALVAAIPQGLLATPDMRVVQPVASYAGGLAWFVDRSAGAVPQPTVLSVPLWWYKAAMLAWALWLSFALTRWVRWAWGVYARDGLWRGRVALGGRIVQAAPPGTPSAAGTSEEKP